MLAMVRDPDLVGHQRFEVGSAGRAHNVPETGARLPGSGSARAWAAVANKTGRRCSWVVWCTLAPDSADRAVGPGRPAESTAAHSGTCSRDMRGPRDGL